MLQDLGLLAVRERNNRAARPEEEKNAGAGPLRKRQTNAFALGGPGEIVIERDPDDAVDIDRSGFSAKALDSRIVWLISGSLLTRSIGLGGKDLALSGHCADAGQGVDHVAIDIPFRQYPVRGGRRL